MTQITMGEVVRLIDGRLAPIGCASETDYERCTCPDEQHCGLRMLMIDVRNAIARILDRYTLEDVVSVTLRKMDRNGAVPAFTANVRSPGTRRVSRKAISSELGRPVHANPLDGLLALLETEEPSLLARS